MRRSFLAQVTILIILSLGASSTAPAAASESTQPADGVAEARIWLTQGYKAFLGWLMESVTAVSSASPTDDLSVAMRTHNDSSQEALTGVESAVCELQSCMEGGPDIDPNG